MSFFCREKGFNVEIGFLSRRRSMECEKANTLIYEKNLDEIRFKIVDSCPEATVKCFCKR